MIAITTSSSTRVNAGRLTSRMNNLPFRAPDMSVVLRE